MAVEPIPDEPAALVDSDGRVLVVADIHAGLEYGLRRQGVELASQANQRRNKILDLLDREDPDRLVVLGDIGHAIGTPDRRERSEIKELLASITQLVPVTLVKGNHDGEIESWLEESTDISVADATGRRMGNVGFAHGHTWPAPDVIEAETVCVGHEHPVVRLEDSVGGYRRERVWLRGEIDPDAFAPHYDADLDITGELVVFPAYNALSGGTWINVEGQEFLSPFLPAGLVKGEAYLFDGTRLGQYDLV